MANMTRSISGYVTVVDRAHQLDGVQLHISADINGPRHDISISVQDLDYNNKLSLTISEKALYEMIEILGAIEDAMPGGQDE